MIKYFHAEALVALFMSFIFINAHNFFCFSEENAFVVPSYAIKWTPVTECRLQFESVSTITDAVSRSNKFVDLLISMFLSELWMFIGY